MEDLFSFIGMLTFFGLFVGCMIGFDRSVTARTQKKMLRLATISIGAIVTLFILMLTGLISC